jgi:hypothetical protein
MIPLFNCRTGELITIDGGLQPLPDGLPAGVAVHMVGIVQTSRLVEWNGQWFEVSMTNLCHRPRP